MTEDDENGVEGGAGDDGIEKDGITDVNKLLLPLPSLPLLLIFELLIILLLIDECDDNDDDDDGAGGGDTIKLKAGSTL